MLMSNINGKQTCSYNTNVSKSATIAELQLQIKHLERPELASSKAGDVLTLGVTAIDQYLPWGGLAAASLHSISGVESLTPALGFAATLLGRAARLGKKKTALWCRRGRDLYAPGLRAFGLRHDNLIIVNSTKSSDLLWAMEEGLRSGVLAVVLGELDTANPKELRRLQLAAEVGGTVALLLDNKLVKAKEQISSMGTSRTHWRVSAAAPTPLSVDGPCFAPRRWLLELLRCRGGSTKNWLVEWNETNFSEEIMQKEKNINAKEEYANDNKAVSSRSATETDAPGYLRLAQPFCDGPDSSHADEKKRYIAT